MTKTPHCLRARSLFTVCCVLFFGCRASAEDWPWFLGPRHDGTSAETQIQLNWPASGPPVLWKQKIGTGYSAPSVLGDRVVIHHRVDGLQEIDGEQRRGGLEIISCRSVSTGEELWKHEYPTAYVDPYGYNNGPRCSPVLIDNRCFTLGAEGVLCCTQLDSGRLLWKRELKKEFDIPEWFFGVGCSPIVDHDQLIVLVGGQKNCGVVSFDLKDGSTRWTAVGRETWDGEIDMHTGEPYEWTGQEMVVSYSSPVISTIHGQRHLLCFMRQGLVSLDPETGSERFHFWFRPRVHESVNAARPVVIGDQIFLSAAYRLGSVLLRVSKDGRSCEKVWRDEENMLAHWSTPIHVDGYIYGFSGRHENEGELRCIRVSDGKLMWKHTGYSGSLKDLARDRVTGRIINTKTGQPVPFPYFGRGSLIRVKDRFIVLGERGTLAVVHVNPQEFREDCRTSFDEISYPAWTAPVLSNGRLYLRSEDWLLCLDVRLKSESDGELSSEGSGEKKP